MINFKQKSKTEVDLVPEAIKHLKSLGQTPNLISSDEANSVSRVNSRAMVLTEFVKTTDGNYRIGLRDKELYGYTQKLVRDIFGMRVLDVDTKTRTVTAEADTFGIALDIIEILGLKYKLSIVAS